MGTTSLNPRTYTTCQTGGGPTITLGHSQTTCFFIVLPCLPRASPRVARGAASERAPHAGTTSRAASLPCPESTRHLAMAPRLTLDSRACMACMAHRSPPALQIPQAWRAAMVGELRRCAASIATSLPTVNSLGGAHERSRYPRRGRAVHFSGGCASGTFRCWLPSHRSAAALRADAVLEAARGQDDVLATLGAWRAAVLRAGGAQRSRSGSSQADG